MRSETSVRKDAQTEIRESFQASGISLNSGDLDMRVPDPLRLSTTKEELVLYLFEKSFLRPNFVLNENELDIPVFFAKADGDSQDFIAEIREQYRLYPNKFIMNSGFHILKREPVVSSQFDNVIDENGVLNTPILNQLTEVSKLKPHKRLYLFSAIEKIVKERKGFNELAGVSPSAIVSYLILENDAMLRIFNDSHYEDSPPKLVIVDTNKSTLNACAVARILLAHFLCFDIIIASYKKFSSIENYFPDSSYDVHYFESGKRDIPLNKTKKNWLPPVLWTAFGLFIMYAVLHWGLKLF